MIPTDELEDYPKRTSVRRALPFIAGILLIAGISYGLLRPAERGLGVGDKAPAFTLGHLDGSGTMSSRELEGHPVVLNFWASWCLPCREEAPLFERKWREYREQGLLFVGVVIKDTPESALKFAERFDLTYPMLFDPDRVLARKLGLLGLPQTFFIDADGRFIGTVETEQIGVSGDTTRLGAIEEEELDRQIAVLLESMD
jgi:cytochrome c biogenesis protein CcmG/thiol:disulfide interchange protein DsbE